MLYLLFNRLILLVLSLLLFFFLHIVHFTLLSQFLSTCICHFCCYLLGTIRDYVNRIAIIWTWSRRLSISEAKRGLSWPNGRWPLWQHFKKGWVQIQTFSLFFWNSLRVPLSRHFIFGATCGGPECEKVYSTFQVLCAVHCLQFLYLDLYL